MGIHKSYILTPDLRQAYSYLLGQGELAKIERPPGYAGEAVEV